MDLNGKIDYHFNYHPCSRDRIINILEIRERAAVFCDHTLPLVPRNPNQISLEANENKDGSVDIYPTTGVMPRFIVLETGRITNTEEIVSVADNPRKAHLEIRIGDYSFRLHKENYGKDKK